MNFRLNNFSYNLLDIVRKLGYRPLGYTEKNELNCVRPMGADYPRFHLYITESPEVLNFSLHLDQRKTSYEGATAHSGDYDGAVVKDEAERIKELLFGLH